MNFDNLLHSNPHEYEPIFGELATLKAELHVLGEDYQAVLDREARIHEACSRHFLSPTNLARSMERKRAVLDAQHAQVLAAGKILLVDGQPELKTNEQRQAAMVYRLVGRVWLQNYNHLLDLIDKRMGRTKGLKGFTSRPVAALEA